MLPLTFLATSNLRPEALVTCIQSTIGGIDYAAVIEAFRKDAKGKEDYPGWRANLLSVRVRSSMLGAPINVDEFITSLQASMSSDALM